jgi:predicted naringenin-chalcone synthase
MTFVMRKEKTNVLGNTRQSAKSFNNFHNSFSDMNIVQISTALPDNEYTTEQLIKSFPCKLRQTVRQNILNLGVSRRSLVEQKDRSSELDDLSSERGLIQLCIEACKKALKQSEVPIDKIGYFVTTYDANPVLSPGLSQVLLRKLGFGPFIKHMNVQGVASTAFPKALQVAEDHLAANPKDQVLICVSGVSSFWFQNQVAGLKDVKEISRINEIRDEKRRRVEHEKWVATMEYFLFGDGVAAAVVANSNDGLAVRKTVEVTNLEENDHHAGYAKLSSLPDTFKFGFHSHLGREIPTLGVKYANTAMKQLLGRDLNKTMNQSTKWAIHTGSQKILDALADSQGIPREKLKESHEILREHGNLAGASLPFILERITSHRLSRGNIVLMLGYGWGFSAAASLLQVC